MNFFSRSINEIEEIAEVADGMIPDSQIVEILEQILSAKVETTHLTQPSNNDQAKQKQELVETL